jgi:hypothetical protein
MEVLRLEKAAIDAPSNTRMKSIAAQHSYYSYALYNLTFYTNVKCWIVGGGRSFVHKEEEL